MSGGADTRSRHCLDAATTACRALGCAPPMGCAPGATGTTAWRPHTAQQPQRTHHAQRQLSPGVRRRTPVLRGVSPHTHTRAHARTRVDACLARAHTDTSVASLRVSLSPPLPSPRNSVSPRGGRVGREDKFALKHIFLKVIPCSPLRPPRGLFLSHDFRIPCSRFQNTQKQI